ncbi:MAG: hypothetical protein ACYS1A_05800 [Planctomycetota bacterium]
MAVKRTRKTRRVLATNTYGINKHEYFRHELKERSDTRLQTIVNILDFAAMAEYWLETTDYY